MIFFHSLVIVDLTWVLGTCLDGHQFISLSRKYMNCCLGNGLVNISAICSVVDTCSIVIVLFTTWCLKWCSRTDRCLVWARVLWLVAISIHDRLSSKVRQVIRGVGLYSLKFLSFNSSIMFMIPITSRNAVDRAIYSASVVDKAIRGCFFEAYTMGHPAYMMT